MGKINTESKKPGVMVYFEILPVLENLWWWQRFAILEAMIYYARDKRLPHFRGTLKAVWALIQPIVDRDDERYKNQVEKSSKGGKAKAAKARQEQDATDVLPDSAQSCLNCQSTISNPQSTISNPQSTISNPQSPDINTQSSYSNPQSNSPQSSNVSQQLPDCNLHVAPNEAMVRRFVEQEGLWVNPHTFVLYYESKGWMADGKPVQDWRALAKAWDAKEREKKNRR